MVMRALSMLTTGTVDPNGFRKALIARRTGWLTQAKLFNFKRKEGATYECGTGQQI